MKIKFNWGIGIAVFYISFVIFLLGNVLYSTLLRSDLVEDDYYEAELKYQEQIDKINRTKELGFVPEFIQAGPYLTIKVPNEYAKKEIKGTLHFYKPSNSSQDRLVKLNINQEGIQLINLEKFPDGLWRLKMNWSVDKISYFYEEELKLNKEK